MIMASEGEYPKVDGDVWYASEVNYYYNLYADMKTYNLAVTDSSAALDFSGVSNKYSMLIRNIGYADCYFDLDDTATTSSMFLPAGAEIMLSNVTFDDLSAITAAGATTLSVAVYVGLNSKTGYKDEFEVKSISATDSSSNVSFTDTTVYKDILITNVGDSEVYVAIGATATTSDFRLEPRESITLMSNKYQFAAICNTGKTATVRILGVY